jgi:hypothetical protein
MRNRRKGGGAVGDDECAVSVSNSRAAALPAAAAAALSKPPNRAIVNNSTADNGDGDYGGAAFTVRVCVALRDGGLALPPLSHLGQRRPLRDVQALAELGGHVSGAFFEPHGLARCAVAQRHARAVVVGRLGEVHVEVPVVFRLHLGPPHLLCGSVCYRRVERGSYTRAVGFLATLLKRHVRERT